MWREAASGPDALAALRWGMTISTPHWDESDARQYAELGNQDHVPILCDAIAGMVDLAGRRVLDFGCGEGHLTLALIERCRPASMIGLDTSERLIETARRLAGDDSVARFAVGDETALPLAEPVDAAICSLMLMMCRGRQQLDQVLRGLFASVQPGGDVVIALTHPCYRKADYGSFRNDLPADFDYWQAGRGYDVQLAADDEHESATIRDTHWTLSDYVNAVVEAGGTIERFDERPAKYDGEQPLGPPAFLLIRAKRSTM